VTNSSTGRHKAVTFAVADHDVEGHEARRAIQMPAAIMSK